jgi:hypothetical protein
VRPPWHSCGRGEKEAEKAAKRRAASERRHGPDVDGREDRIQAETQEEQGDADRIAERIAQLGARRIGIPMASYRAVTPNTSKAKLLWI